MATETVICDKARVAINRLIREWEFDGLGRWTACFSRQSKGLKTSIYVVLRDGSVVHSYTHDRQRGCRFAR